MTDQRENRLHEGALLNAQGSLCEAGYATWPARRYERAAIRAGRLRIKEWDYYCISDETAVLALTIADNGYMGLESVTLIDLPVGWQQTRTFMRLMPLGRTGLPAQSDEGAVEVSRREYQLRFETGNGVRTLTAHVDSFCNGQALDARLTLTDPPEDRLVIATPFAGKPQHFYYNQKINCLRAAGSVTLGGETHIFDPETASAVLDWGRGVWTYRNTWYWSSASGYMEGVPFGFNLGYGFGDTSAASENMLFYKGRAHKLGRVTFGIPQTADGREVYLSPWDLWDDAGRLRLTFTPTLDRAACTNLGLLKSDQHQVFGVFDGAVTLDGGQTLSLTRFPGFAEKVSNRW